VVGTPTVSRLMIPDGTCKALDESGATQQQTCISGAYTLMAMHLIGVHLMGVYFIGVYLIGVYLIGMHLMGMHLIGMYLMGMHPKGVAKSVSDTWDAMISRWGGVGGALYSIMAAYEFRQPRHIQWTYGLGSLNRGETMQPSNLIN
jgi:hypothetical protein